MKRLKPNTKNWVILATDNNVIVADAINSLISLPEETTARVLTFDKAAVYDKIDNRKLAQVGFTYVSEDTGEKVLIDGESVPIVRRGPINLAENDRYGFEFTLTFQPSKKWTMNVNFNVYQSIIRGTYKGLVYDSENLNWFIRLNNKYTLPGKVEWQTRISYDGPRIDAVNKREGRFSSNMAFSKDLFKEKASISFNINDLFNTQRRNLESTTPTFYSDSVYRWRVRSYNLSFTYRFNQKKKRSQGGGFGGNFEG